MNRNLYICHLSLGVFMWQKVKKGIVCLVILLILMSLVPSTAVSEDVSDRSIDLQDNYDLSPEMKRGDNIIPKAEVPTYEFLTYANFGSDNSCYTRGHGVGGYSDKLYVAVNGNCYVYSVTIPAGEDPDMHPNNPEDPGPMATRSLSLIETYNFEADCGWWGYHNAEFYIDENHIYYGPDYFGVGGIEKWAKNPDGTFGTYLGKVQDKNGDPIPVPPENGETFTYDPTANTWYTCTRERAVYSFDMAVDTSWQYEFKYPSYEGGHHDGLEFVNGFLWISDMTTNWIGQWRKNPDGSWEEIARFYYDNPVEDEVEGMGFGPLGHLWVTGWNRLYEIGGKELGEVIKGIELSMTLDKTIYNPKEIMDIHLKITDKEECCTFPISMNKVEIKIDDTYVNIEDGRIDKAIEWAENREGSHDYDGYCWRFVVHAYKKQNGDDWTLSPQGSAKQAANTLEPLKTGAPPRGALAFYDSSQYPEYDHVGLSLGDTDNDGKTEIIHAYTTEKGVIISDDYDNIGGCTYIGWTWPPIKIIYANKEYLIKAKAPSESGDRTVWVQVVTNLGSASDSKSFSVFEPFTFVQVTDVHIGWFPEIEDKKLRLKITKESTEKFTEIINKAI